ncbi:MAG: hypothetical protein GY941_23495 [Planctomycetes bacterium]|nr:hypothetical protein [Planctomycetota bacterium]
MNQAFIFTLKQPCKNRGIEIIDNKDGSIMLDGKRFETIRESEVYINRISRNDMAKFNEVGYEIPEDMDDMAIFSYSGHQFTMCLDSNEIVSADDDCSVTFNPRVVIDINEKNQILYIEEYNAKIYELAEKTILENEYGDVCTGEPTIWGITTADEVIENIRSFYSPETPDFKHWADSELHKHYFSYNSINYIVFMEENGDGWHIITNEDFEIIENAS